MKPVSPTRKQMEDMEALQKEMHSFIEFINSEAKRRKKRKPNYESSVNVYFLLKVAMIEDKLNELVNKLQPLETKN